MAEFEVLIRELRMEDGRGLIQVRLPGRIRLEPGQYLLGYANPSLENLPTAFFLHSQVEDGTLLAGDIPTTLTPGDSLQLRGPLGRGFHVPPLSRRVGLVALDGDFSRLRTLVAHALNQNAGLVCCGSPAPSDLPAAVEVLPPESLADLWEWADYIAWDVKIEILRQVVREGGINYQERSLTQVEILARTALICGGMGECGVCAVPVKKGWQLACKDGPVFDLQGLTL